MSLINGGITHYHVDQLGTPKELTNEQGNIVWQADYKAYGNTAIKADEGMENPLRFQGQYFDEESGLHYTRDRYYHPDTGQFTTQDPISLLGGINSYQYAPNPTGWVDPLGLTCKEIPNNNVVDGLVELDPRSIRTTQTTTKQQGATLRALTESMQKNGFVVEPDKLINVVRMQDGSLTSLDNTRIVAADLAGVKIQARVSNFDYLLPNDADFISRFVGRKGEVPKTFGDAVENRISNQKKAFRETYPLGSPFISFGKNF